MINLYKNKMRNRKKCSNIKGLEERLLCLKEKYNRLTNQLEETRKNSSSDDEMLDYQQVVEEKRIIERYMQKLTKKLSNAEECIGTTTKSDRVGVGNIVSLVNSNSKLKFKLVNEIFSQEDNQISINSPIGKAILGKREGESINVLTPNGKIHYTVKSVKVK